MIEENLKKIRLKLGLSMAKFAEKIEIPAMTLTKYERGERMPSANLFVQLYTKLDINMNWFISGKGDMFNNTSENETPVCKTEEEFEKMMLKLLKKNGIIKS